MQKVLMFLSTHKLTGALMSEYNKMSGISGYDNIIVLDNSSGLVSSESPICDVEFAGEKMKCLLFDENTHNSLKLPAYSHVLKRGKFSDVMWANHDMRFYYVRKYFPDYDYYWQFDYDVFCNGTSYEPFLKANQSDADLLALKFGRTYENSGWLWAKNVSWLYSDDCMYASFGPVTRLSSQAIDFLYKRRLFIAERYKKVKSKKCVWPIGELFIPTELMQNNFTCQRIKYESCSIQEIDLNETRLFENPDNYLYHSVKGDLLNRLQKAQTRRTLFVKIRDKLMGYLAKYKKFK